MAINLQIFNRLGAEKNNSAGNDHFCVSVPGAAKGHNVGTYTQTQQGGDKVNKTLLPHYARLILDTYLPAVILSIIYCTILSRKKVRTQSVLDQFP